MGRYMQLICSCCGRKYRQDWEEPDECPYCEHIEDPEEEDDDEKIEESTNNS